MASNDEQAPAPTVAELLRDGARCNRTGPLWRKFVEFHEANPWVYARIKEMCFGLRAKGWRHYSGQTLIEVLRYEADLRTHGQEVTIDGGDMLRVKLNNNHAAFYTRMLIEEHPTFWDFFSLRRAEGDPTELPPRERQPSLFQLEVRP